MKKRIAAIALSIVMLFTLLPLNAFAAEWAVVVPDISMTVSELSQDGEFTITLTVGPSVNNILAYCFSVNYDDSKVAPDDTKGSTVYDEELDDDVQIPVTYYDESGNNAYNILTLDGGQKSLYASYAKGAPGLRKNGFNVQYHFKLLENAQGIARFSIATGELEIDETKIALFKLGDNKDNVLSAPVDPLNAEVFISPEPATVKTAPTAKSDLVYDGTAKALIAAGESEDGTMNYIVSATQPAADAQWSETVPTETNAGTYSVWYKAAAKDTNHVDSTPVKLGDITIAKADITPTVSLEGWTYGQSAKTPSVGGNTGSGTVSYSYATKGSTTFAAAVPSAAGEYTVKATVAATANYNGGAATADFTIAKADITPSVSIEGWTYGQSAKTPSVSGNAGNGAVSYSYAVKGSTEFGAAAPTDAGEYTVKAVIAASANYNGGEVTADFTIAKVNITPSVSIEGWTYGQTPKTPSVSGNAGNGDISYSYAAKGSTAFGASVPTNAGEYTVKATIAATANYSGAEVTADFTIAPAKAAVTIAPTAASGLEYNAVAQDLLSSQGTSDTSLEFSFDGGSTWTETPLVRNAGTYNLTYRAKADANHSAGDAATITGIVIAQKEISLIWSGDTGLTYGDTVNVTATADGVFSGDTCTVTVSGGAETGAGTHTATATGLSNANYKLPAVTEKSYTVAKADYTGTATASVTVRSNETTTGATLTLPALPDGASYAASGTVNGELVTANSVSGTTLTYSTASKPDSTSATVTIGVTGATNYNNYNVVVTITAKDKEDAGAAITGGDKTVTYGDPGFTLAGTVTNAGTNGAWTWESNNTAAATVANDGTVTITGVGSATITAKYESDDTIGTAQITLTVNKKSISGATITLNTSTALEYNGSERSVSVTGVNVDGTALGLSDYSVAGTTGTNVGTYTVTVTGQGNYKDTATATWRISAATMTVSAPNVTAAYNAAAHGISVTVTDPASGATVKYGETAGACDKDTSPTITDVGTLTVYYKVTAANYADYTGSATVTVTPRVVSAPTVILTPESATYDGTAKEPGVQVKDGETVIDTGEYTVSYANNTDAGTASVTITDKAGGNYTVSGTKTFSITKADHDNGTATGKARFGKSGSVDLSSLLEGGTAAYASRSDADSILAAAPTVTDGVLSFQFVDDVYKVGKDAEITVNVTDMKNYNDFTITVTVTVGAKNTQTLSFADTIVNKTYGDAAYTLAVSGAQTDVTYSSGNEAVASVDASGKVTIKAAGSAVISASAVANDDYFAAGPVSYTLNVAKKAVTVKADDKSKTAGTSDPTLTATVTGLVGSDTIVYTVSRAEGESAGSYVITPSGDAEQGSYTVTYETGTLTISRPVYNDPDPTPTPTPSGTETETTTNDDGSVTETKTETSTVTNADGSVTETENTTETTTAPDGSKTESVTETETTVKENADGTTTTGVTTDTKVTETDAEGRQTVTESKYEFTQTVDDDGNGTSEYTITETVTDAEGNQSTTVTEAKETYIAETRDDGTQVSGFAGTMVETSDDGSKAETVTELEITSRENEDGTTVRTLTEKETFTETDANGNQTVTQTQIASSQFKDAEGNGTTESIITETVTDPDGNVSTTVTEVREEAEVYTAEDGSRIENAKTTETVTDAEGNQTTTVTNQKQIDASDGSIGVVDSDEEGNTLSASAFVSEQAVAAAAESGEPVVLPIEVKAADSAEEAAEVTINLPEESRSVKVEIPVSNPRPGAVAVIVNENGEEKVVTLSTVGENGVILTLDSSATVKLVDNAKCFIDVTEGVWYDPSVDFVSGRELFKGVNENEFAPYRPMTRAMLATVLFRLEGAAAEGENPFDDVPEGTWYTEAVIWANENGIVTGTDRGFEPDLNVTREQIATMIFRYVKLRGIATDIRGDLSIFADGDQVSEWAAEAMAWAVGVGLFRGDELGELNPKGDATRAEVAVLIERLVNLIAQ